MTEARPDAAPPAPLPPDRAALFGAGEALAAEFGVERLFDLLNRDAVREAAR